MNLPWCWCGIKHSIRTHILRLETSVLRIRDFYPGSCFLPIPDPRSRIPDPGSRIADPGSRIQDPGSKNSNKREGWKKIWGHNFLCSHKFANYFSFEVLKKKIWANFQRIIELFTQKIVNKLSKIWVWDPGSGIRDPGSGKNLFRIPDPGVKKAPDPGSGSATLGDILDFLVSHLLYIQKYDTTPPPPSWVEKIVTQH